MNEIARLAAEIGKRYEAERFAISEAARVLQEYDRSRRAAFEAIAKPLEDHRRMMESITRTLIEPITAIEAQQKAFAKSIADIMAFAKYDPWSHLSAVSSEFARIQTQVSQITSVYASLHIDLRAVVTLPSFAGTDHIRDTLRLSELWVRGGKSAAALASSIACTEQHVAAQDEEILQYPAVFNLDALEESEDAELAVLPTLNLYHVQRTELVLVARRSPDALEDPATIDALPSFDYTRTAQAVCGLIPLINQQCAARGEEEIFKPTNQLIRALVTLPNLIAVSRDLFAQFIDCLYFMVYEGAGKDNLRFLGRVPDAAVEPVWAIKHLRNYDLRHDVEHGKPREIEKKQLGLGQDYYRLIGVPTPRTRRDFRNAQLALLRQVESLLRGISDAINALPPPGAAAKE